jgi:hypothetical protein
MTFLPIFRGTNVAALMPAAGGGFTFDDADAEAYVAAMDVEPDDTRKGVIDDFFVGLKTDSLWAKIQWISLLAAHDAQAARINGKTPSEVASAVNSPTFTADQGYTGDGATSYLDTGIAGTAVTATDGSLFIFQNTESGNSSATIGNSGNLRIAGGSTAAHSIRIHTTASSTSTTTSATDQFVIGCRSGTTQTIQVENTQEDSDTVGTSSGGSANILMLTNSSTFSSVQLAVAGFGLAMTEADCDNLNTRIRTYLTAVGAI